MADKKDYYIYVAGEKVLVSKEIYDAITQMDRQERTQSDKDKRNKLLRYEELTTASVTGEELLYDSTQGSVEETVVTTIMCSKLRNGINYAVLTAHSGLAGQRLFSDLDKLECGDTFYVHTLDETMAYMVLEINTVLPEDTSKLVILPAHDVCTLVTCTPYGVNTHRLMVRGTRIRNDQAEYVENLKAERNEREGITKSTWQQEYFKGIGLGVICIAAIGIVYEINRIRPRRRKRGLHEKG